MEEIKVLIAKAIVKSLDTEIEVNNILDKIEVPKDNKNGDFSYPCFNLARILKKSPVVIANEIKENIVLDEKIQKVEVVNGFLNFYLNNENVLDEVLKNILLQKESYGKSSEGKNQRIVIDYSSPNIAKPFHLGHFRNTVLGSAIYKLYEALGYEVIGVNHLGDWGRQFGLIIEGYKRFKDEYDLEKEPVKVLAEIYARMNKLAKEDEAIFDIARANFKKLEQGDSKTLELWKYFREVSLEEYNRIYELLGSKFDSYNGEAFYNDKMDEVVQILQDKGVLEDSQGAKVVNVGEDMPPCIILTSNGTTIYATRDLAAILYRVRTYDFTKAIYITANEQILHFKQVFEVAKHLVDEKYQKGLVHIPYGMIRLKSGKMSTREGTVIYINDLIEEAIAKSKNIIKEKNTDVEDIEKLSKQIGIGALIFNYLKSGKVKDMIFDLEDSLRFDGETGPYVQYTYVRTKSILDKALFDVENINVENISFNLLNEKEEIELVKELQKFHDIIKKAADSYEPSILTRYIIDIATLFSKFYNSCKVLSCEDNELKNARLALVYATGIVIKNGLAILGIECPDKM